MFFILILLFLLCWITIMFFFFNDIINFYFGVFFPDPSTIFFYSLINTHNYIMCLLFFVIILVTWMLFIILRDFFWGKSLFGKNGLYLIYNVIFGFFFPKFLKFYLYFWKFFFIFIFNINLNINVYLKNMSFFSDIFIFNYFFKKNNFFTWKLFFFFIGEYTLKKGCYINSFNFKKSSSTLFNNTEFSAKSFFELNENFLISTQKNLQYLEIFLYGNIFTEGFSKQDSLEKPYVMQQFVHHFKLELFWAIFPTIKCLIILIPSLILLYSSASLKFYDNIVQVTANQWYWNYSSNVLVETDFLDSMFFTYDAIEDICFTTEEEKLLDAIFNNWGNNLIYFDESVLTDLNIKIEDICFTTEEEKLLAAIFNNWGNNLIYFDESVLTDLNIKIEDICFTTEEEKLLAAIFNNWYNNPIVFFFFNESDLNLNIEDICLTIEEENFDDEIFINKNVEFISSINNDSFMIADNDLVLGQQRVLDTDSHLIVSSVRSTRFLVNALDVLHSFVILSTGVKVDAIVGRINEMSVFFLREGLFFGQCSELCGSGHFGMPIVVESLEPFDFFGYLKIKNELWILQNLWLLFWVM